MQGLRAASDSITVSPVSLELFQGFPPKGLCLEGKCYYFFSISDFLITVVAKGGIWASKPPVTHHASIKHSETSAGGGYQRSKLQQLPLNRAEILLPDPKNEIIIKPAPHGILRSPKPAPALTHVTCFPAVCPQNSMISLTKPPKVMACRRPPFHRASGMQK